MMVSDDGGDVVVPLNWMQLQEVQLTAVGQLQAGKNFGGAELIVHAPPLISPQFWEYLVPPSSQSLKVEASKKKISHHGLTVI